MDYGGSLTLPLGIRKWSMEGLRRLSIRGVGIFCRGE
jgi:hypothetical protein